MVPEELGEPVSRVPGARVVSGLSDLGTFAAGEIGMGTMSTGLVEENEEHSHQDVLNPRGEEARQCLGFLH